jgi:hypothetical protein
MPEHGRRISRRRKISRSEAHSLIYVGDVVYTSYVLEKSTKEGHDLVDKMKVKHEFATYGDQDEFDPANWAMNLTARLPTRAPETKLNVLIVGAGFSGLVSALECWRNGHNVIGILDRNRGPLYTGRGKKRQGPENHMADSSP